MHAIVHGLDKHLQDQFHGCRRFAVEMALVSSKGLAQIESAMQQCLKKKGTEGFFLFGINLPTEPEAISRLLTLARKHPDSFSLRRVDGKKAVLHSKMFLFERPRGASTALVGSSNLTLGGLHSNVEVNVAVTDAGVTDNLWDHFNEQFDGATAREVRPAWLREYRKEWKEQKKILAELRRSVQRALRLRTPGGEPKPIPRRIKGHRFMLTGSLWWGRMNVVWEVQKLGGTIGKYKESAADCLVLGNIPRTTVKLKSARDRNIPVITETQFKAILRRERQLRRREKKQPPAPHGKRSHARPSGR